MREIKFRVWDGVGLFPVLQINFNEGWLAIPWPPDSETSPWTQEQRLLSDCIIEQFTGLQDKNGKEIYEGDILEYRGGLYTHNYEVFWAGGAFYIGVNDPEGAELLESELRGPIKPRIIGNIHENPELLEAK